MIRAIQKDKAGTLCREQQELLFFSARVKIKGLRMLVQKKSRWPAFIMLMFQRFCVEQVITCLIQQLSCIVMLLLRCGLSGFLLTSSRCAVFCRIVSIVTFLPLIDLLKITLKNCTSIPFTPQTCSCFFKILFQFIYLFFLI